MADQARTRAVGCYSYLENDDLVFDVTEEKKHVAIFNDVICTLGHLQSPKTEILSS